MEYVRFIENNDWEGEVWHFWIPVEGNEDTISILRRIVDGETYSMSDNALPESSVDVLVAANAWEGNCSYDDANTKLSGRLFLPDDLRNSESSIGEHAGEGEDSFYKGGIRSFMRES